MSATMQNGGAGRGRDNDPPGGRQGPGRGHYKENPDLVKVSQALAQALREAGVGQEYHSCLTCLKLKKAKHRANWLHCKECHEHGDAHVGDPCPRFHSMNDGFWQKHAGQSRNDVYRSSRSGLIHNKDRRAQKAAARQGTPSSQPAGRPQMQPSLPSPYPAAGFPLPSPYPAGGFPFPNPYPAGGYHWGPSPAPPPPPPPPPSCGQYGGYYGSPHSAYPSGPPPGYGLPTGYSYYGPSGYSEASFPPTSSSYDSARQDGANSNRPRRPRQRDHRSALDILHANEAARNEEPTCQDAVALEQAEAAQASVQQMQATAAENNVRMASLGREMATLAAAHAVVQTAEDRRRMNELLSEMSVLNLAGNAETSAQPLPADDPLQAFLPQPTLNQGGAVIPPSSNLAARGFVPRPTGHVRAGGAANNTNTNTAGAASGLFGAIPPRAEAEGDIGADGLDIFDAEAQQK